MILRAYMGGRGGDAGEGVEAAKEALESWDFKTKRKRKPKSQRLMSAFGGKADIPFCTANAR